MTRSTGATGYYSCSDGLHPKLGRVVECLKTILSMAILVLIGV